MSPGSTTESYPAFARIGLRENPGKNLNQVTCPHRDSNPGHLVSQPDALTVTPQVWTGECESKFQNHKEQPVQRSARRSAEDAPFSIKSCLGNCYPTFDFPAATHVTAYSTTQVFEDIIHGPFTRYGNFSKRAFIRIDFLRTTVYTRFEFFLCIMKFKLRLYRIPSPTTVKRTALTPLTLCIREKPNLMYTAVRTKSIRINAYFEKFPCERALCSRIETQSKAMVKKKTNPKCSAPHHIETPLTGFHRTNIIKKSG
ncbi:hypothetical protein ANN_02912 [Periplaneta americana]|uniref:Uncharacterized protein n=1 Tax=Periplaneta americana TaxID=6978 RepID=A0ABQ8TXL0_PERAM|nr:hypothetical protein ANN_02912 [Periplaneta americana]